MSGSPFIAPAAKEPVPTVCDVEHNAGPLGIVDHALPKLVTHLREKPALFNKYLVVVCDTNDSSNIPKILQVAEQLSVDLPDSSEINGSKIRIVSGPSKAALETSDRFAKILSGEWAAFSFPSTNIATSTDRCLEEPIETYRKDPKNITEFLSGLAKLILNLEKDLKSLQINNVQPSFTVILVNPEVAQALKFITSFKSMREYFQATIPLKSGEKFYLGKR